jgi:SWI/SNF-related matrix-associated actin-dependent regulator of chromatin subfamily A3
VFSQFTKFLDIIQVHLKKEGYEFVRVDGSMGLNQRDAMLERFSKSPKHTIMLASLAVCSVGVSSVLIIG